MKKKRSERRISVLVHTVLAWRLISGIYFKVIFITGRGGMSLPAGKFLVIICNKSWTDPRTIVRLEELSQLKNIFASSEIESAIFQLVAQCLYQLLNRVLPRLLNWIKNNTICKRYKCGICGRTKSRSDKSLSQREVCWRVEVLKGERTNAVDKRYRWSKVVTCVDIKKQSD